MCTPTYLNTRLTYIKKELNEKFKLDFRLVDVVNKYREIHYKWQIWEKFIKNKEFILALTCTADVSWLQSKSEVSIS